MTNNFSFKNNYAHNIQDVHIKKEDLLKDIDQQLQSIFTSIINDIDQDKNGIINTKELKAYYENTIESNTQEK